MKIDSDHEEINLGIVTLTGQFDAIQPVQHLHVRISLHDDIRNRNLNRASVGGDPAADSGDDTELDMGCKAGGHLGNSSNIWGATAGEVRGGEVVEP